MESTQRARLQAGFVLHARPYRETSLLVEAFTREFGRIGLVARGARRPKSALRALLQPFHPLLLSWIARTELGTLIGAEPDGSTGRHSGEALFSGLYLNELLIRFLHRHDPHPELYDLYRVTLDALGQSVELEAPLRIFEKHLLNATGYGLVLDKEALSGQPVDGATIYSFEIERGPSPYTGQQDGVRVSGRTLLALASERLTQAHTLSEAKRLMRFAIRSHLGDRPLETQKLFRRSLH